MMARTKPTKKKQTVAEQQAQEEEQQSDSVDDDDVVEVARPAHLGKEILVCCKLGSARKTRFALAKCPDCENCSHAECAKDDLDQEQRAQLRVTAKSKPVLLKGWQCAGCRWKEDKMQANFNLKKKARLLTNKQAKRAWSCPHGCGAGGLGGTGQLKLHLKCYCPKLKLDWPKPCPACGKGPLANPYVLSKHMKKNCKQSGGLGIATATVVTVIGDNTTVNAQVVAPPLHPVVVQQQ